MARSRDVLHRGGRSVSVALGRAALALASSMLWSVGGTVVPLSEPGPNVSGIVDERTGDTITVRADEGFALENAAAAATTDPAVALVEYRRMDGCAVAGSVVSTDANGPCAPLA